MCKANVPKSGYRQSGTDIASPTLIAQPTAHWSDRVSHAVLSRSNWLRNNYVCSSTDTENKAMILFWLIEIEAADGPLERDDPSGYRQHTRDLLVWDDSFPKAALPLGACSRSRREVGWRAFRVAIVWFFDMVD